jgi:hypothetical protein
MVPGDGIEPPTRGFSVHDPLFAGNCIPLVFFCGLNWLAANHSKKLQNHYVVNWNSIEPKMDHTLRYNCHSVHNHPLEKLKNAPGLW